VISTRLFNPGLNGFIVLPKSTGSPPESLQRVAASLTRKGFTVDISRGSPATLPRGQVAVGTITGWLLTWYRTTQHGLAACGSLWAADGAAHVTPFTSGSPARHADNP
jgi:hypothetical protein